jgi:hypothetical protein
MLLWRKNNVIVMLWEDADQLPWFALIALKLSEAMITRVTSVASVKWTNIGDNMHLLKRITTTNKPISNQLRLKRKMKSKRLSKR